MWFATEYTILKNFDFCLDCLSSTKGWLKLLLFFFLLLIYTQEIPCVVISSFQMFALGNF